LWTNVKTRGWLERYRSVSRSMILDATAAGGAGGARKLIAGCRE
jgi:hypothetical protein